MIYKQRALLCIDIPVSLTSLYLCALLTNSRSLGPNCPLNVGIWSFVREAESPAHHEKLFLKQSEISHVTHLKIYSWIPSWNRALVTGVDPV